MTENKTQEFKERQWVSQSDFTLFKKLDDIRFGEIDIWKDKKGAVVFSTESKINSKEKALE